VGRKTATVRTSPIVKYSPSNPYQNVQLDLLVSKQLSKVYIEVVTHHNPGSVG
jgi:hypothetical protein